MTQRGALLLAALVLAPPGAGSSAAQPPPELVRLETDGERVRWVPLEAWAELRLVVSGSGEIVERRSVNGEAVEVSTAEAGLPDGNYTWEIRVVPGPALDRVGGADGHVQSGYFDVVSGAPRVTRSGAGGDEGPEAEPVTELDKAPGPVEASGEAGGAGEAEPVPQRVRGFDLLGLVPGVYYAGTARTTHGTAVIDLPESLSKGIRPGTVTVQVTPLDGWARLYVVEKNSHRVVVRDADGADGVVFDFLVLARRHAESDPARP